MKSTSNLVHPSVQSVADTPAVLVCWGEALVDAGLGSVSVDENGDDLIAPVVADDAAARTSEHPVVMALV